jgi:hypothetical protein
VESVSPKCSITECRRCRSQRTEFHYFYQFYKFYHFNNVYNTSTISSKPTYHHHYNITRKFRRKIQIINHNFKSIFSWCDQGLTFLKI